MKNLTVQLPEHLQRDLEQISRQQRRSTEDVAREMLERGVRGARFRELRGRAMEELGPDAAETDQEAFDEMP